LKSDPALIARVSEIADYPALGELLKVVNAVASPIESVGCECRTWMPPGREPPHVYSTNAYVDVVFSSADRNRPPENHLRLAATILDGVRGCERWWGNVEIALQPMHWIAGPVDAWGTMIKVSGAGRSEAECAKLWAETMRCVGDAIQSLPAQFPD